MRVDWLLLLCLSFSVDATSHQDGEVDDSVSGAAGATSSSDRRFRVALHAQVSPGQGFVVGSVITTAGNPDIVSWEANRPPDLRTFRFVSFMTMMVGMEEAFKARDDVEVAQTFYPFEYKGLHDHQWDLVVIEGWFPMINSFIHEVRYPPNETSHTGYSRSPTHLSIPWWYAGTGLVTIRPCVILLPGPGLPWT